MVLSVSEAAQVANVARAQGLKFVPLRDPRVPLAEAEAALRVVQNTASTPLVAACSADSFAALLRAEDWQHAPMLLVRKSGVFHPRRIIGAMPRGALQTLLRERLASMPRE
jgi:hypothetical protein